MKKDFGFTLIEVLMVFTIIGIVSVLAVPMYTDNVRKTRGQEAVNTIDAMKEEIDTYVSERSFLPSRCDHHNQILATIGVQIPDNGKRRYWVRNNGVIVANARAPLGGTFREDGFYVPPKSIW